MFWVLGLGRTRLSKAATITLAIVVAEVTNSGEGLESKPNSSLAKQSETAAITPKTVARMTAALPTNGKNTPTMNIAPNGPRKRLNTFTEFKFRTFC